MLRLYHCRVGRLFEDGLGYKDLARNADGGKLATELDRLTGDHNHATKESTAADGKVLKEKLKDERETGNEASDRRCRNPMRK